MFYTQKNQTVNQKIISYIIIIALTLTLISPALSSDNNVYASNDGTKLSANPTEQRTAEDVLTLYDNSVKSYDTSNMFATAPNLVQGSYNKGELSADAIEKTTAQINYFRALAGITPITTYTNKLDVGQYGATGMEIVGALTHKFTTDQAIKLSNYMTAEEITKAAYGIGAGNNDPVYILWNGNCSSSNNVVTAIKRYVDDTSNRNAGVGHRFNMLSLIGEAATFGASLNEYSCTSIYGNPFNANSNNAAYYPWPAEGFFPKQSIDNDASWSIVFSKENSNIDLENSTDTSNVKVTLEYGGTSYDGQEVYFNGGYKLYNGQSAGISYKLPTDLKNAIADNSSAYDNAGVAEVKVKVTGLKNTSSQPVYAEYTTKLFKSLPIPLESISLDKTDVTTSVGVEFPLGVTFNPTDTTDDKTITWSSSNPDVASVTTGGIVNTLKQGTTTITALCMGKTAECSLTVKKSIEDTSITPIPDQRYNNGTPIEPDVVIKDGDYTLREDEDFVVEYLNNTDAGEATVSISGINNYTGNTSVPFQILSNVNIGTLNIAVDTTDKTYDGQPHSPTVTVKDGSTTLVHNTDYTVSYTDNVNAGTATVTVAGKGFYIGQKQFTFIINKAEQIISAPPEFYLALGTKYFPLEATLVSGDSQLKYTSSDKKVTQVSSAGNVSITGPGRAIITTIAPETENYAESTAETLVTVKPRKVTGVKLKAKKGKKVTVSWTKNSRYSGYEIKFATDKKFKNNPLKVHVKKGKSSSKTISKLKKNKNYHFKVRAYITIDGQKFFGSYSAVKKIKVKK